ncbi:hypothetical protein [Nocardia callitridis]|uniref:Resolvase/invertase-type recombinase catalytic domain-containing protein n=1 Tax=Nocardia callitridis TaxID=648753 RepID=A0ABP9L6P2_9NOCA
MTEEEPFVALGYMRTDLSGDARQWDAKRLRALASRYGYQMGHIVTHTSSTPNRTANLLDLVRRMNAVALFVPTVEHLPETAVRALLAELDGVTTLYPEETYAPYPVPPAEGPPVWL